MLFRKEERVAVEDKYEDTALYEALAGTCRRLMNGAEKFRLHPTELFYQTFVILDWLKGKSLDKQKVYCNDVLWDELYDYLCYEKGIKDAVEDVRLAISCIMQAVAELLIRSNNCRYTMVAGALKQQIEHHVPEVVTTLDNEFRRGFRSVGVEELAGIIGQYLESSTLYSVEIDELLDGMDSDKPVVTVNTNPVRSHIRIANKKMTSVLTVLNAMYKAGWFVDENGQPLTNRDDALNEILQAAFNDSCNHIAQMLQPSNNLKSKKQELLIRQLLDEKDMKQFITDLIEELLRNVK